MPPSVQLPTALCVQQNIYCPSGIRWLTFCRHNMEIEYFKRPAALGKYKSAEKGAPICSEQSQHHGVKSHVGGR